MTQPCRRCSLAAAAIALALGGCSLQYNGALGDKPKAGSAGSATGDEEGATVKARAARGSHALGPVDSVRPSAPRSIDITGEVNAGQLAVSPDGSRPRFADAAGGPHAALGVYGELPGDRRGTDSPLDSPDNVEQVTFSNEGADFDPEIDPTGKWIVFASTRHRESADIYLQRVGGTTVTQLTNDPGKDIMPTFSPDGAKIAFASDRAGNWDIYMMDPSGGQPQQITSATTHDLHPSFSPDGSKLVYCSYGARSGQWELVIIDLANPANRQIIGHGLFPQWSPRGDKILFQRARDRGTRWFSVWTLDIENGEARRATEIVAANNAAAITPCWSPDGGHIVFSTVLSDDFTGAQAPVQADVWIVAADGSGRVNLTTSRHANLQPVWGKDGAVYFVSNRGPDGVENIWAMRPDRAMRLAQPASTSGDAAKRSEKAGPAAASATIE